VSLRTGITTGTCAAAAAKAAVMVLCHAETGRKAGSDVGWVKRSEPHQHSSEPHVVGLASLDPPYNDDLHHNGETPKSVAVQLPGGETVTVAIEETRVNADGNLATASVRKDAGDDPDVTHGLEIRVTVRWSDTGGVTFSAGEGVGMVTRPGLQVPPGEPAINPGPRRMIEAAIREATSRGVHVEVAIPGGQEVAARTFNPRLGIEGGLSILGTTGIVRPYCMQALHDALRCAVDVARACGVTAPVLVPGAIGAKAAAKRFVLRPEQLIEVSNAWGFVLDLMRGCFQALLILGHPGKLAKMAAGQWNTHSSRSDQAVGMVADLHAEVLGRPAPEMPTTEGIFETLQPPERAVLGDELARRVRQAVESRLDSSMPVAVVLINMAGDTLGQHGDLFPWQ
jgi:cobalt-precorrin-5B (C1)-methyltransferase